MAETPEETRSEQPQRPPRLLRSAEVLEACGISHQVLYRYVTLGLVKPTETTPAGHGLFHPRIVPLIKLVQGLKERYALRHQKEIFFKDERVRRALREAGSEEDTADSEPDADEEGTRAD